jgi:hypothetical protein
MVKLPLRTRIYSRLYRMILNIKEVVLVLNIIDIMMLISYYNPIFRIMN